MKKQNFLFNLERLPVLLLLVFTSMATWDIVAGFSPPMSIGSVSLNWVRPLLAVAIFDGGLIYWEWRAANRSQNKEQSYTARTMQALTLLFILVALIGDAFYRQHFVQIAFPAWGASTVILAPVLLAFIYLVGHTLYVWFDPDTRAAIARRNANEEIELQALQQQEIAARRLAPQAGRALAMARIEDDFRQIAGRDISEIIPGWHAAFHLPGGQEAHLPSPANAKGEVPPFATVTGSNGNSRSKTNA